MISGVNREKDVARSILPLVRNIIVSRERRTSGELSRTSDPSANLAGRPQGWPMHSEEPAGQRAKRRQNQILR